MTIQSKKLALAGVLLLGITVLPAATSLGATLDTPPVVDPGTGDVACVIFNLGAPTSHLAVDPSSGLYNYSGSLSLI